MQAGPTWAPILALLAHAIFAPRLLLHVRSYGTQDSSCEIGKLSFDGYDEETLGPESGYLSHSEESRSETLNMERNSGRLSPITEEER